MLLYSPLVQFQLLHSRFHLCSAATRGLLLSTYVKFINLFPEIKAQIQEVSITCVRSCVLYVCLLLLLQVLRLDSNVKNSDAEIQQRALEYLQLSSVTSSEVLVRNSEYACMLHGCVSLYMCVHVLACNRATPAYIHAMHTLHALMWNKLSTCYCPLPTSCHEVHRAPPGQNSKVLFCYSASHDQEDGYVSWEMGG